MTGKSEVSVKGNGNNLPLTETTELHTYIVVPPADVVETPEMFQVVLDMPGATKENITVRLEKATLEVKGYVERPRTEDERFLVREIQPTGYARAFTIGQGIDRGRVEATFHDGVLTVTLFKAEELKPKEIRIQ